MLKKGGCRGFILNNKVILLHSPRNRKGVHEFVIQDTTYPCCPSPPHPFPSPVRTKVDYWKLFKCWSFVSRTTVLSPTKVSVPQFAQRFLHNATSDNTSTSPTIPVRRTIFLQLIRLLQSLRWTVDEVLPLIL